MELRTALLLLLLQVTVILAQRRRTPLYSNSGDLVFTGSATPRRAFVTLPPGNISPPQPLLLDMRSGVTTEPAPVTSPPHVTPTETSAHQDQDNAIPLDEFRRLNEIDNIDEFLARYMGGQEPEEDEDVTDLGSEARIHLANPLGLRFDISQQVIPKSNIEMPKPARCEPELTTVSLQNASNGLTLFFPSCTRVMRCGGCCNTDLLSCQPTDTTLRNFQVYAAEYTKGRLATFRRKEVVTVEEHTKCTCDCKIKEQHCNSFQTYSKKDCRCRCINHEDRQKCETSNSTKIWDYQNCMCRCRDTMECTTGYYFDEHNCSCRPEPVLVSRYGENEQPKRRRRPGTRFGYTVAPTFRP